MTIEKELTALLRQAKTARADAVKEDDSVVLAQPAADPPITPLIPFTKLPNVENPLA